MRSIHSAHRIELKGEPMREKTGGANQVLHIAVIPLHAIAVKTV